MSKKIIIKLTDMINKCEYKYVDSMNKEEFATEYSLNNNMSIMDVLDELKHAEHFVKVRGVDKKSAIYLGENDQEAIDFEDIY